MMTQTLEKIGRVAHQPLSSAMIGRKIDEMSTTNWAIDNPQSLSYLNVAGLWVALWSVALVERLTAEQKQRQTRLVNLEGKSEKALLSVHVCCMRAQLSRIPTFFVYHLCIHADQ